MAAGSTYTPIATTTLGSSQASVTFSSIPSTYTDLVLVGSVNTTTGLDYWYRLNSSTASIYSNTRIVGNGSAASSLRGSNETATYFNSGAVSSGWHQFTMHLFNYSNTSTYKTQLIRFDNSNSETVTRCGLWRSTNAITTILIQTDFSTFAAGSTFTLYGIAAA